MDLPAIKDIYDQASAILEGNGFLNQLKNDTLVQKTKADAVETPHPTRALCWGLGRFRKNSAQAQVSCVQLLAFECILGVFEVPKDKVLVHDPGFNETDKAFIDSLGYTLIDDPVLALEAFACEEPTIVYTPFLPLDVLEQLYEKNWNPDLVNNLVIFGHRLAGWWDDPIVRLKWLKERFRVSYSPHLDRCLPIFDVTDLTPFGTTELRELSVDKNIDWPMHELVPIIASQVSQWAFEWVPPYRVHALGSRLWEITPVTEEQWAKSDESEGFSTGKC